MIYICPIGSRRGMDNLFFGKSVFVKHPNCHYLNILSLTGKCWFCGVFSFVHCQGMSGNTTPMHGVQSIAVQSIVPWWWWDFIDKNPLGVQSMVNNQNFLNDNDIKWYIMIENPQGVQDSVASWWLHCGRKCQRPGLPYSSHPMCMINLSKSSTLLSP